MIGRCLRFAVCAALGLGATMMVGAPAAATVLADWDVEELVRRADLIVVGTVKEQRYIVDEALKAVLTESEVVVERTLQGKEAASFVLTQLGGRAGSVVSEVVGDARLAPGDRVLLFTFRHEDGRRYLVGMALGAWFVVSGEEGSFSQDIESPLVDASGAVKAAPGRRTISVDDVRAAVEKIAKGGSPATSRTLERTSPTAERGGP